MAQEEPRHLGEFELIDRLTAVLNESGPYDGPPPFVGAGDDAAVVQNGSGYVIQTTDTMVDGVHFRAGHMRWFEVGWKSIVSNQSDIAAMGGTPTTALVTLGIPKQAKPTDMDELYKGMAAALREFGGRVVGGDVVASPVMFITVAMCGDPVIDDSGDPVVLRRDSAMAGDLIAVTGPLGGAAGGLAADSQDIESEESDALRQFHYRPEPRVKEGRLLVELGIRCAMDISDGLIADIQKIAAASEMSARISSSDVPVPSALRSCFPGQCVDMALTGGEDYELVLTAPHDIMDRALARLGRRARHIGRMVEPGENGPAVTVLDSDEKPLKFESAGWDHLIV